MIKVLVLAIALTGATAFASGEGPSDQPTYSAPGSTTVHNGSEYSNSNDGSEAIYVGPGVIMTATTAHADYNTLFATAAECAAHCQTDYTSGTINHVMGYYNWHFKLIGYKCVPYSSPNDGGGN